MRYLIPFLFPLTVFAETTSNLVVNGDFETGNANGWTQTGAGQVIGDCCSTQGNPSNYDYEFGDYGAISQDFKLYSDTITNDMLDLGIVLSSEVLVQNGEGGVGGWASNRGGADEFTITLRIKDNQSNILSETTQSRTQTTNIYGQVFEDILTYTGSGSRIGSIELSGTDANAPATLGGSNLDDIKVFMEYSPIVLTTEQTQEIQEVFEEVEQVTQIEEFIFEEIAVEPMTVEETAFEPVEEIAEVLAEEEFVEQTIILTPTMMSEETVEETVETVQEPTVVENTVETVIESEPVVEETTEVAEEVFTELVSETETESETNNEETTETIEENNTETNEETEQAPSNNNSRRTEVAINISDISKKVAEKIKSIDGQLVATQMIVSKVMQSNSDISSYSDVNKDIFIQPEIQNIDISSYTNNTYVDIRNIYPNQIYEDRLWTSRQ
mgnify:CR=1 FL=1